MEDTNILTADTGTQNSIEKELNNLIDNYDSKLKDMRSLYNEISLSSSWKDTNIKTSFLNKLDKYLKEFEEIKETMTNQVSSLSLSTTTIDSIESTFS